MFSRATKLFHSTPATISKIHPSGITFVVHFVVLHGSDMLMWISQCADALCRAFQLKLMEVAHRLARVMGTRPVS